ncbi:MAG: hypothetical protein ACRDJE_23620 [Dehalococcoidia bacterium]
MEPKKVIKSLAEIPDFDSEEEEQDFWDTHTLSTKLLDELPEPPPEMMPPVRDKKPVPPQRYDR